VNNTKMKITYDPKADAAYIQLKRGAVKKTKEEGDFIIVDYGAKGEILGIEILFYSKRISLIKSLPPAIRNAL
jgi:uncharacterized protein YuzE